MQYVLVVLGAGLVIVGLLFAFGGPGAVKAGGSALKSVSLEGPAWLMLVGIGVGVVLFAGYIDHLERTGATLDKTAETLPDAPPTTPVVDEPSGDPFTYGDDEELDAMWDDCDKGVWAACDDLYLSSPLGSDYEWFGASCGELIPDPIDYCDLSNREGGGP